MMSSLASGLGDLPRSLLREARRRVLFVAVVFSLIALGGLVVGLLLPKTWECSALLVPDSNAIKPLMEGHGVSGPSDIQLTTMTQAVQTRKIMREVLAFGGWLNRRMLPQQEEILLARLRSRLHVESTREATIRISYRDDDAKRTFLVTNKMVEIMIREAASAKETSSRETYEFIERQVKEYGDELAKAHEKLLAYYRSQGAAVGISEADKLLEETPPSSHGTGDNQTRKMSVEELAKLRAEEATLTAQLSHARPAATTPDESRKTEEQLRAREEQMRFEYERLASSYTELHPDVVRKKNDLEMLRADLRRLEAARLESERAGAATAALDDQVTRAARTRLEEVRALLSPASKRSPRRRPSALPPPSPVAETNLDPNMKMVGQDSKLSELLRRYEATRDVYQDLLKKRETARLSKDLDVERSSVILRVQEPATMPVIASGLRVMHKSLIGIALAVLAPLGVLFAIVSFDGRVRGAEQIERMARVPILVRIPYAPSGEELTRNRIRRVISLLLTASVFAAYIVAYLLTTTKVPR
jgi:polysaccharide chain length determinant protein (PEP-CTERM system associated)